MRVVPNRVALSLAVAAALSSVAASASAAEILSVKNESANFREGPGDKHAILYSADRYYPVEILDKKDGWAKVKDFEGDVAWVAARLLTKQETVVVEGDRVNVREKPTTSSEIAFKSERGEVFKVESHQGRWLKVVDASGDGGWIRDDMVWGEKVAAAEAPKGKTKGEIDEPGAKPGDKGDKGKGDKGDKATDKPAPKKADKGDKPKDGKPERAEKAKANGDEAGKGDDAPAAEEASAGGAADDAKAETADAKLDAPKSPDAKASDADAPEEGDADADEVDSGDDTG